MLEEVELYVYDKYIKGMIVEDNGVKKIPKEELEKLKLSPNIRELPKCKLQILSTILSPYPPTDILISMLKKKSL